MMKRLFAALLLLGAAAAAMPAAATDFDIIEVPPGQTVDVYFQINLSDEVYINIRDKDGPACADLWWISWPLGNIIDIGRKCGGARLEIPGVTHFSVASKLRAGGVGKPTKIGIAASETVAHSITFTFP